MEQSFREALTGSGRFLVTLELVPGPESRGRSVDAVKAIAEDARKDGRIAAVSITDNPGGNASLSPDVLGREIQDLGMDVIVHCTCRDLNRAGLESRALQLARMGMTNILALTGDYSNSGFAGQGLPVFDLDSVLLTCMLNGLNHRMQADCTCEGFSIGCAVSPFKSTEAECFAQYAKLRLKASVGACYIMTQLGYDARKFQELLQMQKLLNIGLPALGTVYVLTPGAARSMHRGNVPGAVVTRRLLEDVEAKATDKNAARQAAVEQAARLAVVLKGLGYRGIHLGGVHRTFDTADRVLSRMAEIEDRWQEFLPDFDYPQQNGFYFFEKSANSTLSSDTPTQGQCRCGPFEKTLFQCMRLVHHFFFRFDAPLAGVYGRIARMLDQSALGRFLVRLIEDPAKGLLLKCKRCGDCAIQHIGFLCPESQCPKHIRNGACGGSVDGRCEVYPDRPCVYVRCYNRLDRVGQEQGMGTECVPPRLWTLNQTSSWLNFHLHRDHQSLPCEIAQLFDPHPCPQRDKRDVTSR